MKIEIIGPRIRVNLPKIKVNKPVIDFDRGTNKTKMNPGGNIKNVA